ncbi:MAG: DMT family transporter [Peptococcales bacterium]|jgi:drug/metabolite transporter (DMT)-like permease
MINPYVALFIGVLGVSSSAILVKLTNAPPVVIAVYRMIFTFLMLLPVTIKKSRKDFQHIKKSQYFWAFISGLFISLHFITWFSALQYTSVASATVLVDTHPLFVLIFGYILWRETFPLKAYLGVFLALIGTVILSWGDFQLGVGHLKGDFLALIGAFTVACYYLCGRHLRKTMNVLPYTTLVYGFSALFLLVVTISKGYSLSGYSFKDYLVFLSLAFFCTIMGHTILNWALKFLPTASVSVSVLGEPVIASVMAFFIFGESLTQLQLLGSILVLSGIFYFGHYQAQQMSNLKNEPVSENK